MTEKERLIVGISGASGVIYGIRLLELLYDLPVETHLVMTRPAELVLATESDLAPKDVRALADVTHPIGNMGAVISSGSFRTMGMVAAPCSMKSLAEIATGMGSTLL
ncbi:MAG: flavoprotein, partial [Alphaproteobacteria bacterium]|nr:flavoprotein [Alphaproteobacteria bacterium]